MYPLLPLLTILLIPLAVVKSFSCHGEPSDGGQPSALLADSGARERTQVCFGSAKLRTLAPFPSATIR